MARAGAAAAQPAAASPGRGPRRSTAPVPPGRRSPWSPAPRRPGGRRSCAGGRRKPVRGEDLQLRAEPVGPAAEDHVQVAAGVGRDPAGPERSARQPRRGGGHREGLGVEPLDPGLRRRRLRPAARKLVAERVELARLAADQGVRREGVVDRRDLEPLTRPDASARAADRAPPAPRAAVLAGPGTGPVGAGGQEAGTAPSGRSRGPSSRGRGRRRSSRRCSRSTRVSNERFARRSRSRDERAGALAREEPPPRDPASPRSSSRRRETRRAPGALGDDRGLRPRRGLPLLAVRPVGAVVLAEGCASSSELAARRELREERLGAEADEHVARRAGAARCPRSGRRCWSSERTAAPAFARRRRKLSWRIEPARERVQHRRPRAVVEHADAAVCRASGRRAGSRTGRRGRAGSRCPCPPRVQRIRPLARSTL